MKVFQIEREIEAVVQGDRSIQEYATDLERLWNDYDNFSLMASCQDPGCKRGERDAQRIRTMHFLRRLNPAFEQRTGVLLSQARIPSLEEVISAMIQKESCIGLHTGAGGLSSMRSALAVSNLGNTGAQGETCKCYNRRKVGHLSRVCPRPPKERETGGREQSGGRGHGRGSRRGGRGGYRANLMVAEDEGEICVVFTDEDHELLEMLKRKQRVAVDGYL